MKEVCIELGLRAVYVEDVLQGSETTTADAEETYRITCMREALLSV